MKKNGKLSLKVETIRNLTPEETSQARGGFPSSCLTAIIPSSGITILFFKACYH